jgi:hypothetical protein
MQMGKGGLMKGQDLASTFSFLRPNDLVWNYVVGNYLKGETPPAFDLLYWNSDSTNLPGPFYAWYLRNTYLENRLVKPGKATVCGVKVDFRKVDIPVYIYGSREDHIVPIAVPCVHTPASNFVMGASGISPASSNPPAKNKRSYWPTTNCRPCAMAEGAKEHPALVDDWTTAGQAHATFGGKAYSKRAPVQSMSLSRAGCGKVDRARPGIHAGWQRAAGRYRSTLRKNPWKTSSSFPPPAPPWASLAARSPKSLPPSWAASSSRKPLPAPASAWTRSAKSSWARCWLPVSVRTRRARR